MSLFAECRTHQRTALDKEPLCRVLDTRQNDTWQRASLSSARHSAKVAECRSLALDKKVFFSLNFSNVFTLYFDVCLNLARFSIYFLYIFNLFHLNIFF